MSLIATHEPPCELRPFQLAALNALAEPGHVICVSRTGSGKSLIYERAASQPGRRTLLVSPLTALAFQQRERLQAAGVRVKMGSGGSGERPTADTQAWIVSPETLRYASYSSVLEDWKPDFLVVDECHCLWDWGEGFRPDFLALPDLIPRLRILRSLWLTATLPVAARCELRSRLPQPLRELGRFELPPALHLEVKRVEWKYRCEALLNWIEDQGEHGIVFVSTREQVSRVARLLTARGHPNSSYHAGLSREERRLIEARVAIRKSGIIVATSAFGMGMDHSHLAWTVLWQAPSSLLGMTQSIGRVGRSELQGRALVFWDFEDFRLLDWTARGSQRRETTLSETLEYLKTPACRKRGLELYYEGDSTLRVSSSCCDFCDSIPPPPL